MPDISPFVSQRPLDRTSPSGGGIRSVSLPRAGADIGSSALEGIARVAPAVTKLVEVLAERDMLLRQAEETVQLTTGLSTFQDGLVTKQQALYLDQSISPLAYRAQLSAHRDQLLQEIGGTLPARIQPLFQANALKASVPVLYDTDRAGVAKFGQQAEAAYKLSAEQLQRQATSGNALLEAQATQQHEDVVQRYVAQGLFSTVQGDAARLAFTDQAADTHLTLAIQRDPQGMVTQLALGPEANPGIAPAKLPKFQEYALGQLRLRVAQREHDEGRARRQLQDSQKLVASSYRGINGLSKPGITIPEILTQMQQIEDDRQVQRLGEEDHGSLLITAQALMEKLRQDVYKDQDVPPIRQQASFLVETADTPAQLNQARDYVLANGPNLNSGTFQAFLARIDVRREQSAYSNRDAYKEGRGVLLGVAFPGGIVQATMEKLEPAVKTKVSTALEIYAETMQTIYEREGRQAGDAQAREKAQSLSKLYFPKEESKPEFLPGLPPEFQGLTYPEALKKLEGLHLAPTLNRQLYLKIKQALPYKKFLSPSGEEPK